MLKVVCLVMALMLLVIPFGIAQQNTLSVEEMKSTLGGGCDLFCNSFADCLDWKGDPTGIKWWFCGYSPGNYCDNTGAMSCGGVWVRCCS